MIFCVLASMLAGLAAALAAKHQPLEWAIRSETIGGGLMATSLIMLGIGLNGFLRL